jgi:hypothetical protein
MRDFLWQDGLASEIGAFGDGCTALVDSHAAWRSPIFVSIVPSRVAITHVAPENARS